MLTELRQIDSELKFSNKYWDYRMDRYVLPGGGEGEYHYVDSRGSTIVIPLIEKSKFILVRQYRYLNRRESLEFPGGGISAGLSIVENALKELSEETGYQADELLLLGENNPFKGVTNEICSVVLARGLSKAIPNPECSEEFEIVIMTIDEIVQNIKRGIIWDGMTLAAWSTFYFSEFNSAVK